MPLNKHESELIQQRIFGQEKLKEELSTAVKDIEFLQQQLETGTNILLPIVGEYLEQIRGFRMALGREVQDMLRTMRELGAIYKGKEEITAFADAIKTLREVLDEETIEKLRKIIK